MYDCVWKELGINQTEPTTQKQKAVAPAEKRLDANVSIRRSDKKIIMIAQRPEVTRLVGARVLA